MKGLLVPFLFLADKTEIEVYAQYAQQGNTSRGLLPFCSTFAILPSKGLYKILLFFSPKQTLFSGQLVF